MRKEKYSNDKERLEFNSITEPNTGCWLFTGYVNEDGYGRMRYKGSIWLSHRASYDMHRGDIPNGMQILHTCDQPCCVNPDHFFIGSHTDNMRDMQKKGRKSIKFGEKNHTSKMNLERAMEARWYSAIGFLHKQIAVMYGVTRPVISKICRNESWQQECHN